VGLAPGFDKDVAVPRQMLRFGFGFVECGTVTPNPQSGNSRPRLFRLTEDRAVINRMGFNNQGMRAAAERLVACSAAGLVGINIGANKTSSDRIADYRRCFDVLAPLAAYVTVNISSPNTPGLRGLQNPDELKRLLDQVMEARGAQTRRVPVLLKIAPDLDGRAMDEIARACVDAGIDGIVVSNTTVARPMTLKSALAHESGGLSGQPLFEPSTSILRQMRERLRDRLVLVGVGGIQSGAQAYAKIRAGATLVQRYTALVFRGPALVCEIKRDLLAYLARDGFQNVGDAVGADVR
jgi:dihydroorotate dehydrogenase